ncbi:C39 family peptidase [Chakrabartyella piscis]|uniref:C39 family peptidase n=1 Tax=Chakrabartyella piscis TaxID=2918914 RepID=UPI0029586FAB|nr:C39 family peptidase [Chakrabartyella piscis]
MNRYVKISFEIPFYNQRITTENWQSSGFSSELEGISWTERGCGIASLRMILDGFLLAENKPSCPNQGEMIEKGLAQEAYNPGIGWIHAGLAHMAEEFGISAVAYRGKTLTDVANELEQNHPCIISITPRFRGGLVNEETGNIYGKGGHLVVAYGCTYDETGNLTGFLVHHPSCFLENTLPAYQVDVKPLEASFSGNFIAFGMDIPMEMD